MARDNDVFVFKRSVKKDETVPQQAQVILKVIHDSNGGKITRAELLEKLGKTLQTKQDPARVLSFYRGPLITGGLIQIIKGEVPVKPKAEKKAAKPKPAKKAAAKAKPKAKAKKVKAPKAEPAAPADEGEGEASQAQA